MSAPRAAATAPARTLGSVAIVVTVLLLSVWGAVGLWSDLGLPLTIVGPLWVSIALASWALYGAVLLLIVRRPLSRAHIIPLGLLLALAWGGLAATDIAGRANSAAKTIAINVSTSGDGSWTNWLVAPAMEESIKTAGILMLALLPVAVRFGPAAGLALGALVGVSFQVVENFIFTLQGIADAPDQPGNVLLSMFFIRGVVGFFSHLVYSGVIGAALGWAIYAGPNHRARRWGVVLGAWLLMVMLHSWSNWTVQAQQTVGFLATMLVGLVVIVVVMRWSRSNGMEQATPADETDQTSGTPPRS